MTLRQLAAELGVSAMAVSMALRNHPRVSANLRARAQALARARGYVPNPAWSRRSSQRRGTAPPPMPVALIWQANPIWPFRPADLIGALQEAGCRLGYRVTDYAQNRELPPERLGRMLWQIGAEAVLLGPVFNAALFDALPWDQFSVVAVGSGHYVPPCHWVTDSCGEALAGIAERCLERGYRRVALLQYREPVGPADRFERDGAIHLCRSRFTGAGAEFEVFDALPCQEAAVFAPLRTYRPDAIIGQTPRFYLELHSHGWPVGRRIGFAVWMLDDIGRRWRLAGCSNDERRPVADYAMRLLDSE
ncbi:MAG: LacI family DNA-binding transcriptional regulator, partial [Anaerolineae bacterium]|nr:LacI family DNA-binding transcriptional regulator [Anaerolineae bacterium]